MQSSSPTFLDRGIRRLHRTVRTRIKPILTTKPRILHLVYQEPDGPNRGDAAMGLAIPQILRRINPALNIRHFRIGDLRARKHIRSQIGPCELVVIGGGGLYGKWHSLDKLLELAEIKKPFVLYGMGLNVNHGDSALGPEKLKTISDLNQAAALTSVRDKPTHQFLRDLGIESSIIGDPAAFYEPPGAKRASHSPDELHLGINIPRHGFHNQEETLARVIPIMRDFCLAMKKSGAILHYMLHYPDEVSVVRELGVDFAHVHQGRAVDVARAYHQLDFMVGGMLHSNIFAFAAGVPFLALAYDSKHQGFLDLIESQNNCLELRQLERGLLHEKAGALIADRENARARFQATRQKLWETHRAFAASVVSLAG